MTLVTSPSNLCAAAETTASNRAHSFKMESLRRSRRSLDPVVGNPEGRVDEELA